MCSRRFQKAFKQDLKRNFPLQFSFIGEIKSLYLLFFFFAIISFFFVILFVTFFPTLIQNEIILKTLLETSTAFPYLFPRQLHLLNGK